MNITPETLTIIMCVIIGIAVLFGLYKLATSSISERSVLKTGTSGSNGRQVIKAILAIIIAIAAIVGAIALYEYFTSI